MFTSSTFVRLWRKLTPFHSAFKTFLVLIVMYEGLQIFEGYLLSLVIDMYGGNAKPLMWGLLIIVVLVYDELFMSLDNKIDWHIITRHAYPIYKYLHMSAFKKFMGMDMKWHQDRNSGALVGKVNNGVAKTDELLSAFSWEFLPTMIQCLLSLIPLLYFSWPVALIAIVIFPIFMKLSIKSKVERSVYRQERHDLYEDAWHKNVENVQAVETAVMFNQTERIEEEYENLYDQIESLGRKEARIGVYKYNRYRIRLLSKARRVILVILVLQLYGGALSIAGLIYVNTLMEKLFHSFWRFARLFDRAYESVEGVERLVNLMDEETGIQNGELYPDYSHSIGIEFRNVCFSYNGGYSKDHGAIHDFNLTIEPGQVIALVGPSGAGKTTIRKIVTRLMDIQQGSIKVGGVDVQSWDMDTLRSVFAYVPQGDDVHIFADTMYRNIAYSRPQASRLEVVHAAQMAGIHDFIMEELPDGYDTLVGEKGKKLSGGQKQRVALARAILADRPILIFDEATSAVDAITEHEIQTRMEEILTGRTAIIIAHRLSTIWNIADKIVVMKDGRIVEEGSHMELMENPGLYAEMVGLQLHS